MQALRRLGIRVDDSVSLDILLGENFNGKLYDLTPVQMEKVRALREVVTTYNTMASHDAEVTVDDSLKAAEVVYPQLRDLQHEEVWAAFLSRSNKVIKAEMVFSGALTEVTISPRTLISRALCCNAAALILYHCHPSGNPRPSEADLRATETLRQACSLMDIVLLDHIIITRGQYYSFMDGEVSTI